MHVCVCVEVMSRNLAVTVCLDGKKLTSSLTLHHLMRGQTLFDLLLDLHTHTCRHTLYSVCNKDGSTPASNATSKTDGSVDGQITPHPAAPSVSLLRGDSVGQVLVIFMLPCYLFFSEIVQLKKKNLLYKNTQNALAYKVLKIIVVSKLFPCLDIRIRILESNSYTVGATLKKLWICFLFFYLMNFKFNEKNTRHTLTCVKQSENKTKELPVCI